MTKTIQDLDYPRLSSSTKGKYYSIYLYIKTTTSKKLAKTSCESVRNFIVETLIPKMFKIYPKEHRESSNLSSIEEFLDDFEISKKGVSHTTTWRWLHKLRFDYKGQKSYFSDKHKNEENVTYWEGFIEKYFESE